MHHMLSSFLDLVQLQSEMNKLFEALQGLEEDQEVKEAGQSPPYDVLETPDSVIIEVDLPGVERESLSIVAQENVLVINGVRRRSGTIGIVSYHLMERDRGPFTRRIPLEGALDTHGARAVFEGGVLSITLPRLAERRGNEVPIPLEPEG